MELVIKGDAKEIAALVLGLQGQQELAFDEVSFAAAIKRHQELQDPGRQAFVP